MALYWGNIGKVLRAILEVILGICWGFIGVMLGLDWGFIGVLLGLYGGCIGVISGLHWGYVGVISGLYCGYIGVILEWVCHLLCKSLPAVPASAVDVHHEVCGEDLQHANTSLQLGYVCRIAFKERVFIFWDRYGIERF